MHGCARPVPSPSSVKASAQDRSSPARQLERAARPAPCVLTPGPPARGGGLLCNPGIACLNRAWSVGHIVDISSASSSREMVMGFPGAVVYSARSVDILFWNAQRKERPSVEAKAMFRPFQVEAVTFAARRSPASPVGLPVDDRIAPRISASQPRRAASDWCLARHLLPDTDQLAIEGE